MKDVEFKKYLLDKLEEIKKGQNNPSIKLNFRGIDKKHLDSGQLEMVIRTSNLKPYCGISCEACKVGFINELDYASHLIIEYLDGKLTKPTKILNFCYFNKKLSESMTVLVYFQDNVLKVVSGVNNVSVALQNELVKQDARQVEDLIVPKKMLGYTLMGRTNFYTAFEGELT